MTSFGSLIQAAVETLRFPLTRATYRTLIRLLAVSGMRVGEAIGLDRTDLDLTAGCVTVRGGKPGAGGEPPLHDSTLRALREYGGVRGARAAASDLGRQVPGELMFATGVDGRYAREADPGSPRLKMHPGQQAAEAVEMLLRRASDDPDAAPRFITATVRPRALNRLLTAALTGSHPTTPLDRRGGRL